jgi:VIT1/CCC1 family predicted Fe2+/Mn2+ transporter
MVGLIDGSLSTLAPIFSVAIVSHKPLYAFAAGLATSIGAAISEGLSDTGELTGRGSPATRGAITGAGTFLGGILHTLPFLLPTYHTAIITAIVVVGFELVGLAWIRWRFFGTSFTKSLGLVSFAGLVIAVVGALVGAGV